MVRRWETQELNTKMDNFAEQIAKKHPFFLNVQEDSSERR